VDFEFFQPLGLSQGIRPLDTRSAYWLTHTFYSYGRYLMWVVTEWSITSGTVTESQSVTHLQPQFGGTGSGGILYSGFSNFMSWFIQQRLPR
jgi:hypothetical protein